PSRSSIAGTACAIVTTAPTAAATGGPMKSGLALLMDGFGTAGIEFHDPQGLSTLVLLEETQRLIECVERLLAAILPRERDAVVVLHLVVGFRSAAMGRWFHDRDPFLLFSNHQSIFYVHILFLATPDPHRQSKGPSPAAEQSGHRTAAVSAMTYS